MRQLGHDSWQLRVYLGLDSDTGRQRWAAQTVHGSRRYPQAQLARLVNEAQAARTHAGTVTDLLQRWFTGASPNWAASTVREIRSLIRCHLDPHLGYLPVVNLTTADTDDFYAPLLRAGGRDGRPLAPGTVHRVHVVLH
jgi:integrase